MSEETPFINVLLLGDEFSPKSTFIDLFANYLKHENLSSDMNPITENGTSYCGSEFVADYIFDVKNVKLRLIDTPDLFSIEPQTQILNRSKNLNIMNNIICKVAKYSHINAIAFVITYNMELIEDIIVYLLPHFDKSMCQNVIFIYIGEKSSFNCTSIQIKQILKENSCFKQNTFILCHNYFGSYLVYLQTNSAHYRERYKEEDWQEDRICCKNFIDYIVGDEKSTGLMPHFIKPVKDDFDELFRFLADSVCALSENSKVLQKQHGSYNNFYFEESSLISLVKATTTGKSVNICRSARCTEFQKKVNVPQKCCERANSTQLNCSCGCPMNMHYSAKYLMKLPHQTNCNTINPLHNNSNGNNGITFASIQEELNQVLDSLVTVSIYKIQTYKVTEDPFASYLDNYTHVDHINLKILYYGRKQGKETTTITLQDISTYMQQLKTLNWMGSTIKNIYGDDFNIKTEIAIENQLKTNEKSAAQLRSTTQKLLHKNVNTKPCSLQNTMNNPISFKNEIKVVETSTISKLKPEESLERNHIQLQHVQEGINKFQLHGVQRSNSTYGMPANLQYGHYNPDGTNIQKATADQIVINQGLTNEIKLLKQQNNKLLEQVAQAIHSSASSASEQQKIVNAQNTKMEQTIKSIQAELNSIRAETAKNQELINKIENNKQENISKQAGLINEYRSTVYEYTSKVRILEKAFNKHVVQAENQQILNSHVKQQLDNLQDTKNLKKQLSDITQAGIHPIKQRVNNLQVDIEKLKESIQLTNNCNASQDENHASLINQRIDNLCDDMKIVKQSIKELSNITLIEDRPINQYVNNLRNDITNIKEFMQDLSNEIKEMKQLITNVIVEQQSISGVQAETLQSNQEVNDEQPKKFQKLIEDINNLKRIKEMQECDDEINVEGQEDNAEGETSQSAQPKFQKLIEDLSNLKKLKEQKDPNENNEMMEEVKRITGQQISKQFEDLKVFIKDTLANKQNGEDIEVDNKQEKQ